MNIDGHVIDLSKKRGLNRFSACRQVEAYWEGLRGSELVPNRSQIDPRGIEDALNNAFILEAIGAGNARVRIAGTHLNELMGMEVRGMPISTFFTPASRDAFSRAIKSVLESPATMQLTLRGEKSWAQPTMEAKMLLLPLRSDLGDITRIMGCLETLGAVGTTPRRFELLGAEKRKLMQKEDRPLGAPRAVPQTEPVLPEPGFAEPTGPFERPQGEVNSKRPSYLKLVK